MAADVSRLRRVTDLFTSGIELELGTDKHGVPILVWVSKPNQFERGEARKDGLFGKQKKLMMLTEDSEEIQTVRAEGSSQSEDVLINALLTPKDMEFLMLARDDVHADDTWRERLELLERWEELTQGGDLDEAEGKRFVEVSQQYLDAVQAALEKRTKDARAELASLSKAELVDAYVEGYRQMQAMDAFQVEAQITELFYALRDCVATARVGGADDGPWDHKKCTHPRLVAKRPDVRGLGDGLLERARAKLRELQMSEREAGNSDAPASSSASSERPSQQAESTPSTPDGT